MFGTALPGVLLLQKVVSRERKKSRDAFGGAAVRVPVIPIVPSEMHAFTDLDAFLLVVKPEGNVTRELNDDARIIGTLRKCY